MAMNKIVGTYVLLSHHFFSEKFIIHTDAIKTQLWGVINLNMNPNDFYSPTITPQKTNYKTTER